MKDIVFRGKCVRNGEWVYGNLNITKYCIGEDRVEITGFYTGENYFCEKVDPETVGQFTGRYDADGKMIFEQLEENGRNKTDEVRRGEWHETMSGKAYCPYCKTAGYSNWKYCRECGAEML